MKEDSTNSMERKTFIRRPLHETFITRSKRNMYDNNNFEPRHSKAYPIKFETNFEEQVEKKKTTRSERTCSAPSLHQIMILLRQSPNRVHNCCHKVDQVIEFDHPLNNADENSHTGVTKQKVGRSNFHIN